MNRKDSRIVKFLESPIVYTIVIVTSFNLLCIIVVDYSNQPDKYKNLLVSDEIRREGDLLERRVNELSHTAVEKLDLAGEKLQETNTEFEKARAKTKKAQQAFERSLARNNSAQAVYPSRQSAPIGLTVQ
ncbi:hypothetical protein DAPPUDRAFT_272505 [Daphnia pulex]|uniref:Uncharacterized protein n=1 Tax=Daphnia pulex TaxID=6669 RepID=E9I323_DAPPU|nr:hypothetical protein DAPPUDRAFT_272505 [Daphnia pulex]|eukprot:EFX61607.1 hypothetical protein DAPPUDRAFT_272505 [Daphnia pulex]